MTSQGTARGRFQRAIHRRHVEAAETAAREMEGSLFPMPSCSANFWRTPTRLATNAPRCAGLQRFIDERLPPLTEVELDHEHTSLD